MKSRASAEHAGRPVLMLAADPAFEIDAGGTSRLCFFPGRSWSGKNRFEIATVSTLSEVNGDRDRTMNPETLSPTCRGERS